MFMNAGPAAGQSLYHEVVRATLAIRNLATAVGVAVALGPVLIAGPGLAEETTVRRATEAASLHEGPLDMVAYYVPVAGKALEVTATFAARAGRAEPMRIVMALADGDDVAFAMPGHAQSLYRFVRAGDAVTMQVHLVGPGTAAGF